LDQLIPLLKMSHGARMTRLAGEWVPLFQRALVVGVGAHAFVVELLVLLGQVAGEEVGHEGLIRQACAAEERGRIRVFVSRRKLHIIDGCVPHAALVQVEDAPVLVGMIPRGTGRAKPPCGRAGRQAHIRCGERSWRFA